MRKQEAIPVVDKQVDQSVARVHVGRFGRWSLSIQESEGI
jgi:hypothetical protein